MDERMDVRGTLLYEFFKNDFVLACAACVCARERARARGGEREEREREPERGRGDWREDS
jgi:hypothetical protein